LRWAEGEGRARMLPAGVLVVDRRLNTHWGKTGKPNRSSKRKRKQKKPKERRKDN